MQLIIVVGLIAKLALVSCGCDVGKTVHDFNIRKFTGTWYFQYHNPGAEYDNLECPIDNYVFPVGNSSRMISYVLANGELVVSKGFLGDWNSTGYSQKFDGKSSWSGRIYIVAVDYWRYVIGKLCTPGSDKVFTFVAFRSAHPDNATMENMEKALRDNNIEFKELKYWNPNRCGQLSVG